MKKIGFFSALILPVLLVFGMQWGGPFQWMIHIFVFLLVPLMDYVIQKDTANVPTSEVSEVAKKKFLQIHYVCMGLCAVGSADLGLLLGMFL